MHTPAADSRSPGVGTAAKQVADHAKSLLGLELELARLELTRKLTAIGIGIAFAVGGAIVALYGLGFLFATLAAVLATFLPTWLSLLIVTLFLLALAGALVFLGLGRIRQGTPPVPEQAIKEAKLTTEALRASGTS